MIPNIKTMAMRGRVGRRVASTFLLLAVLILGNIPVLGSLAPQIAAAEALAPEATSYYVDSVSGSDSNSGTSADRPWKSLSPVRSFAFAPGDKIHLKRGSSWSGGLIISRSGTEGNPITFTTYGTGNRPVITNSDGWANVEIKGSWIVLEGLLLRNSPESGVAISGSRNIVRDIEITDAGAGVSVRGPYNLITKSYIHDLKMIRNTVGGDDDYGAVAIWLFAANNEVSYNRMINLRAPSYDYGYDGGGVELYGSNIDNNYIHHNYVENADGVTEVGGRSGSAANNTIAYNVFVNNYGRVLTMHLSGTYGSTVSNFRFENNTIVESNSSGLGLFWFSATPSSSAVNMRNNIFYKTGGSVSNRDGFAHSYNLYYLTGGATLGSLSLGSNERIADPQFVSISGRDFHLKSGSPAIDRGTTLGHTRDYYDGAVPQGAAPDIGACEFGATAPAPIATPMPLVPPPAPGPNDVVIDDSSAGFSQTSSQDAWVSFSLAGGPHYGSTHYYNELIGTGADKATWSFSVPTAGHYVVYASWYPASYRPTDVPYTINYSGGSKTVRMNQQIGGGQWNFLGRYYFQGSGSVVLSDNATNGRSIVADAVRLVSMPYAIQLPIIAQKAGR